MSKRNASVHSIAETTQDSPHAFRPEMLPIDVKYAVKITRENHGTPLPPHSPDAEFLRLDQLEASPRETPTRRKQAKTPKTPKKIGLPMSETPNKNETSKDDQVHSILKSVNGIQKRLQILEGKMVILEANIGDFESTDTTETLLFQLQELKNRPVHAPDDSQETKLQELETLVEDLHNKVQSIVSRDEAVCVPTQSARSLTVSHLQTRLDSVEVRVATHQEQQRLEEQQRMQDWKQLEVQLQRLAEQQRIAEHQRVQDKKQTDEQLQELKHFKHDNEFLLRSIRQLTQVPGLYCAKPTHAPESVQKPVVVDPMSRTKSYQDYNGILAHYDQTSHSKTLAPSNPSNDSTRSTPSSQLNLSQPVNRTARKRMEFQESQLSSAPPSQFGSQRPVSPPRPNQDFVPTGPTTVIPSPATSGITREFLSQGEEDVHEDRTLKHRRQNNLR